MIPQQRLNDVFPRWLSGGGIFTALQEFPVPWKEKNISLSLDIEYHGNISGDKIISPMASKILTGEALTQEQTTLIATAIMALCGVNWGKQWQTMEFEYNPIENYSMVEQMLGDKTVNEYGRTVTRTDDLTHGKMGTETTTIDSTDTRTDNLTHGKTGTETTAIDSTDTRTDNLTHGKTGTESVSPNITETTIPDLTTINKETVNGFNSPIGVPTGAQTETATGKNTVTRTGTETTTYNTQETETGTQTVAKTGTDTLTHNTQETETGTQTTADGGKDTHTRNYKLTRSGNIGVTTSQQMIESERDLWVWNYFRNIVFPDVDRVLTIQIY